MLALCNFSLLAAILYEFRVREIILTRVSVQGSSLCKEAVGLLPMSTEASNETDFLNSGRHHTYFEMEGVGGGGPKLCRGHEKAFVHFGGLACEHDGVMNFPRASTGIL